MKEKKKTSDNCFGVFLLDSKSSDAIRTCQKNV
uniref:Uncharacterized protein n=1 Tax=Rhizophora mucronata TaxID=61149 RepID=A0A2P2QYV1_RHIMU